MEDGIITLWKVVETIDDRGGEGATLGYFKAEGTAKLNAKGKGWYGGDANVYKVYATNIGNHTYELFTGRYSTGVPTPIDVDGEQKKRDEELRAQTKASLTDEQLRVLGLKR